MFLPLTNLGHRCRAKYKYGFSAFPMFFMFLSFVPLFFIWQWVALKLGIPNNVPLKNHPHSGAFTAIVLPTFAVLFFAGYLLGFAVNALVLKFICGWSNSRLRELFLESNLPDHWYKRCPQCNQARGHLKAGPKTNQQIWWGGWTCPNCGCDVTIFGKSRSA